jgi:putative transposase
MQSAKIQLSCLEKELLEKISRQSTSSVRAVERSKILLYLHASGTSSTDASKHLSIKWPKIQRWRCRWLSHGEKLKAIEEKGEVREIRHELLEYIQVILSDSPRSGAPATFTAHEYCQILGVALESPELSERPISEWTVRELTDEVIKRKIVPSISKSQVGSFLKSERGKAP